MSSNKLTQEFFFSQVALPGMSVCIYLINGIKLEGTITMYDDNSLLLASDTRKYPEQLIYKHAISTISRN